MASKAKKAIGGARCHFYVSPWLPKPPYQPPEAIHAWQYINKLNHWKTNSRIFLRWHTKKERSDMTALPKRERKIRNEIYHQICKVGDAKSWILLKRKSNNKWKQFLHFDFASSLNGKFFFRLRRERQRPRNGEVAKNNKTVSNARALVLVFLCWLLCHRTTIRWFSHFDPFPSLCFSLLSHRTS